MKTKQQKILVHISVNNFQQDIINFTGEFILPKVIYDLIYDQFYTTIQTFFKNTELNYVKSEKQFLDVLDKNEINECINI